MLKRTNQIHIYIEMWEISNKVSGQVCLTSDFNEGGSLKRQK